VCSFAAALDPVQGDVRRAVPPPLIGRATAALGLAGRDRILTPAVTTHLAPVNGYQIFSSSTQRRPLSEPIGIRDILGGFAP
jgi:hypothetical protein